MKKVEIFGVGCPNCKFVEKKVEEAIKELGISVEVKKITDVNKIVERGVIPPAVVVDGSVKSEGRIPTREEIEKWLR
jgi:small redox-active disulfide protein 2